jgi:PAS domain S-box-containing protein
MVSAVGGEGIRHGPSSDDVRRMVLSSDHDGAVQALRQLAELLDGAPVGLAMLDRDLRFRFVNALMARMNGHPVEAHLGRTPMELVPGVPSETYLSHLRAVLDGTDETIRVDVAGETAADPGSVRAWEETFFAVRDRDGQVVGIGMLAADVTDRRAAEESVRRSEATLRLILDSAPNGLLLVDRHGRIQAVNRECARLFGYKQDELVGRPVEMLVPEDLRAQHEHHREVYAADPVTRAMGHQRDLRARRKDGSEFPVEVGLAVAQGAPGLVTCAISDISERKRAELERVALHEAERAAAQRLARLQKVTEAGLAQLPLTDLMRELLIRVIDAVDADAATLFLTTESSSGVESVAHVSRRSSDGLHGPDGREPGAADRLAVGAPNLADRVARDGRPRVLGSVLALPLVVEGSVMGVLQVAAQAPKQFTDADIEVVQPFADRVALAVDRARVFERERDIARTLQRSLLPAQLPKLPDAETAARYLPGAEGTHVGGDWYDVLVVDGDALLVIGDVMGRGVRAASVMGQLRAAVRIYAGMGLSLPEVASRLNSAVLALGESEMATLLLARLVPSTGELEWVSAGHVPPVVRDADGEARLLENPEGTGIALGAVPDADYPVGTAVLEPGTTLLLYTDGLVERPEQSLMSGLNALTRTVAEAPADPEGLCDAVLRTFFPSGRAGDDVALLGVHLLPVPVRPLMVDLVGGAAPTYAVRARLRDWLQRAGATEEEAQDVLVAVSEAFSRSAGGDGLAHGAGDGAVLGSMRVELRDGRVEVALSGPAATPPEGTDRGRGLLVMESVVNELSIRHEAVGGAEELRLVRRLVSPRRV